MVKKIRGIAISTGVTIGFLVLLAIAAKKTNVGNFLQESLKGFGLNVGQGITAPFTGILDGLTIGGEGLGKSAVSLSEGFQKSVSSTLGGGENVFSDFGSQTTSLESITKGLLSSLGQTESNIKAATEGTDSFQSFIDKISLAANPIESSPTVGIYTLFGSTLPLSQAAVDYYKRIGTPLNRIG